MNLYGTVSVFELIPVPAESQLCARRPIAKKIGHDSQHRVGPLVAVIGATLGLLLCRWDTAMGGVVVSLSFSPGSPGVILDPYCPALSGWLVAFGVIGFAGIIYTLGVKLLPIFPIEYDEALAAREGRRD